jgi:hypothetical protein
VQIVEYDYHRLLLAKALNQQRDSIEEPQTGRVEFPIGFSKSIAHLRQETRYFLHQYTEELIDLGSRSLPQATAQHVHPRPVGRATFPFVAHALED